MPGVLRPLSSDSGIPQIFSQILQQMNDTQAQLNGASTNTTRQTTDQYGNCVAIIGQLNQTVTEGAAWNTVSASVYAGVSVGTGLTGSGIGYLQSYVTTGTFSSGTNSITVTSATGFAIGMGIAGPGIPSGTTISNVSGTTITLSQNTTAAGSGVPVTAWIWRNTASLTYP